MIAALSTWSPSTNGSRTTALAPMLGAGSGATAVPDRVVNDVLLRGSLAEIRAHLGRYLDAGIETALLNLSSAEPDPARKRELMLAALRALAPRS